MKEIIEQICHGHHLSFEQSRRTFERVMAGELTDVDIAALLIALKSKGENFDEIAGAAFAMRAAATAVPYQGICADSCGTGGDGAHTINVSTAVALVVAACGLPVAKHGNRSVSSKCGSADVLEACGVTLETTPEIAAKQLQALGVCFLFAPKYHPAVRHVMPVRQHLKTRTIFNLLGPLCNPANPTFQVTGVYDPKFCKPLAETLGKLGVQRALVVHGSGLDELAIHGPSAGAFWDRGALSEFNFDPKSHGIAGATPEALKGGDPEENARLFEAVLKGEGLAAHNDIVAVNAGALLWTGEKAASIDAGIVLARNCLKNGGGFELLQKWIAYV